MSQAYSIESTKERLNSNPTYYGKAHVLKSIVLSSLREEKNILNAMCKIGFFTPTTGSLIFYMVGFHEGEKRFHPKYKTIAKKFGCSVRSVKNAVHELKRCGILGEAHRCRRSKEFFIRPLRQWHFLLPLVKDKVKHFKRPCPRMSRFIEIKEHAENNSQLILNSRESVLVSQRRRQNTAYSEVQFSHVHKEQISDVVDKERFLATRHVEDVDTPNQNSSHTPYSEGQFSGHLSYKKTKTAPKDALGSASPCHENCPSSHENCPPIIDCVLNNTNTNTNNNIRGKFCLEDVIEGKGGLKVDRKGVKFVSLINREITRCGEEGLKKILKVYGEGFKGVDDEGTEGIRSFCFAYVMAYHLKAFRGVKFAFVSKTDRDALRRTSMAPGMSLNDFQKQMPFFCQNSWGYDHGFTTYSSNRMRMRRASCSFRSLPVDRVSIVPVVSSVVSVVQKQEVKIVNNTKRVAADALPAISGERKTEILIRGKDREGREDTVVPSAPVVQKLETKVEQKMEQKTEQKMTPDDVLRACWVKARVYYVMLADRTLEDTEDLPDNVLAFFEARGCAPCKTRVEFFKTFNIMSALGEPLTAKAS